MEIKIARTAGFCFGVHRAVALCEEAARQYPRCATLGAVIHNKDVIRHLEDLGVRTIARLDEAEAGDTVILRSHGEEKAVYDRLDEMGTSYIDATCPDVRKIHRIACEESEAGRSVVVIGGKNHPETLAIAGWCENAAIVETAEELEALFFAEPARKNLPVSVVSQTTGNRGNFERCVKFIKKECTNFKIFDTICNATFRRQQEAAELSEKCGGMIVIGDQASANTRRLYEICHAKCARTVWVENAGGLDPSVFSGVSVLGITAGASTPAWIIKEVYQKMSEEIKSTVAESEEPVITAEAEAESFEEMLEKSIKTLHTGEKVVGVIAAITPTEVSVDLGTKQSGYIPLSELTDDPNANASDLVKVGDEIETYVMRVNDVEGTVMLSKKRLDSVKAWDEINEARTSKEVMEGVVVEENKGGVVVSVKGVRVFVPASQTGLPKDTPMATLLKTKVRLRITEVNQPRRRVVGSIRAVAYEERRARAESVWNEIEEGKHYNGVVKSLTSYGAFVDIGGIDGMVHVSELSWSRINQPSDILSVGDEIDVYVISFDKEKRKISLGYKDKSENPWLKFSAQYDVGSVANVKIVKLMPFGAFAEIVPGVDGLIHISQIADHRIGKPDEVLAEGQEVEAKVIDIDGEKQKVSLSIRALLAPAAPAEAPEEEAEEAPAEEIAEEAAEEAAEAPAEEAAPVEE